MRASKNIQPLSRRMIEVLMECHEREIMKLEPLNWSNMPQVRGLLQRGMVKAEKVTTNTGKQLIGFFITQEGKKYLSKFIPPETSESILI